MKGAKMNDENIKNKHSLSQKKERLNSVYQYTCSTLTFILKAHFASQIMSGVYFIQFA